MARRTTMVLIAATAVAIAGIAARRAAASGTPIALLVTQSAAFSALGHSCGGIQEQAFATGFDPTSGYPTGDVYVQTRCGGSGRGGGYHVTTYSAWLGATWDYAGTMVSFERLTTAPSEDPLFSAADAFGNQLYDTLNVVNAATCSVENTTYCTYRAWLTLADGFVPSPSVTGLSVVAGPTVGGTTVTITGTNLLWATEVDFGDTPAASVTVNGDTSINATSPAGSAGTVDVVVKNGDAASATTPSDQFTFVSGPTVTGISPDSGPANGGTLVTISGTNFVDVVAVYFGETPVGFTVDSDTSIIATSAAGQAGDDAHVKVVTIGGTSPATGADTFTYSDAAAAGLCGDGALDPGEDCDDGAANGQAGDCCTATCTFQDAGASCADDGTLCTADVCDGAGVCAHPVAPSLTCTPPDLAGGGSLLLHWLKNGHNQSQFQWAKGPALALADFGDPGAGDRVELCVYGEVAPDQYALLLRGAASTSDGGAWRASRTSWKFRSATGTPDGIRAVTLTASALPFHAKLQMKANDSPNLTALPLPAGMAVVAEVRTSGGVCFGATFSTPTTSTAAEYKAKSDAQ